MAKPVNPVARRLIEIGIKGGYAYDIANGRRPPSPLLALKIFRATGLRLGPIADLPDEDIAMLEKMQQPQAETA